MDSKAIFEHWSNWAETYGTALRATTKTGTAKQLELDALARKLKAAIGDADADVLEIGCGNGINCISLAPNFPKAAFDGIDYIEKMIVAARDNLDAAADLTGRVRFFQGDALKIAEHSDLKKTYDVIFTNRCLINLNTIELQKQAITSIAGKLKSGGHLVMIENSLETYGQQNGCREVLGLPARTPAEFNLFFDETEIRPHLAQSGLTLEAVEDFSSLHDLVLYALVPAINGGKVDYEHPIVQAATVLNRALADALPGSLGPFGQNRLFYCRKHG